ISLLAWVFLSNASVAQANPLVFCCHAHNDLYALLRSKGEMCDRFDDPLTALDHTPGDGALLILAEQYPEMPVAIPAEFFGRVKSKGVRLYVEFPDAVPGLS